MPDGTTTTPAADSHGAIEVRGARQNNLTDVSLDIPKRRLTVFTGVSGSGKSSLVFGTIAAESQRLINETYAAFVQSFLPSLARPDVDSLRNLSAAIVVDQERPVGNSRSSVGTATDASPMLRVVFSTLGRPAAGLSSAYSPNSPDGMCPSCDGLGRITDVDAAALVDEARSLNDGAITVPNFDVGSFYWRVFIDSGYFDPDLPVGRYATRDWDRLMNAPATKIKSSGMNLTYEGLLVKVRRLYLSKDVDSVQPHIRRFLDRAVVFSTCPGCDGKRLNEAALASKINGLSIADCSAMPVNELAAFTGDLHEPGLAPLVDTLNGTLQDLHDVGLGYLSLDREVSTLSGGESQRVKMVRHLGSSLSDITYVFDEPSTGLHPHDIQKVNELLLRLRDKGNTVLVVEHQPAVIAIADRVVDLGPGAGLNGGRVCYEGGLEGLAASGTVTGDHLHRRVELRRMPRHARGHMRIEGADRHNLKHVDVEVPVGVLTVVTGVAGSGKSTLIHGYLARRDDAVVVDQAPIRGSRRSNPATYTGLLDAIRPAFAKANNVKAGLFSANSEGACPACKGLGFIETELVMMTPVATVCERCAGRRFTPEVLGYRLDGKNIDEVLSMSVSQAHDFFATGTARSVLNGLVDVGLGYLRLGQPLNTLSGGERQRLKLALRMAEGATLYILDEPTAGLHMADVQQLLRLLDRLVDGGASVVVIEHNQAVMAHADWIIDMGPGAGREGGQVVFSGLPADLVGASDTLTARHLRRYVER